MRVRDGRKRDCNASRCGHWVQAVRLRYLGRGRFGFFCAVGLGGGGVGRCGAGGGAGRSCPMVCPVPVQRGGVSTTGGLGLLRLQMCRKTAGVVNHNLPPIDLNQAIRHKMMQHPRQGFWGEIKP